jgi:hypothetical protein
VIKMVVTTADAPVREPDDSWTQRLAQRAPRHDRGEKR